MGPVKSRGLLRCVSVLVIIVLLAAAYRNTGTNGEENSVGRISATAVMAARTTQLSDGVPMTTSSAAESSGVLQICLVQYIHVIALLANATDQIAAKDSALLQRENEVLFVLQKNLRHPHVKEVHVIAGNKSAAEKYLESKRGRLKGFEKIVSVHDNKRLPTYADIVSYISDQLQYKLVMFANEDIYLGEGFEKINLTAFQQTKTAYSLTRHNSPAFKNCQSNMGKAVCSSPYHGSHDAYMFYITQKVSVEALELLDYPTNKLGIESRFMWVMKNMMGYCVLNPCKAIYTYHIHCSGLHGANRTNIRGPHHEHNMYRFRASPSATLHC